MTTHRLPFVSSTLGLVLLLVACAPAVDDGTAQSPSPTASASGAAAPPRTIEHAMGDTTIPEQPERVVVLDTGELDSMVALGIVPVGAVRAPVQDGLLDYLQGETQGVTELVGTIDEPNLEQIAALQPDLIVSSQLRHEDLYDELSQIAPTVFTETVGVVWKENFLVHAEAVGLEAEAEQMLADYEARADDLGARLEDELGALPAVSIVRFLPGETRLYQRASFIGTVLDDVGLPRPESQDADDFALVISEEQIALADGDVIFVTSYGPTDESTQPEFTSNPLWDNLGAVEAGQVYEVPDDTWMLGIGIGAANIVLDDLERYLVSAGS
ncbi:MAG: ABC transporter substrate-binding protein [Candidatus Limnocylindria bacterium]